MILKRNFRTTVAYHSAFPNLSVTHICNNISDISNMGAGRSVEEKPYSVQENVPSISKRTIGKLIVKHCGNEGQEDDPTLVVSLRRILQDTITKLDTETEETWKNAQIVIYDQQGNDFCVQSGEAENKFVVQLDEKDDINITCTHRKTRSFFSKLTSSMSSGTTKRSKSPAAIENNPDAQMKQENKPSQV